MTLRLTDLEQLLLLAALRKGDLAYGANLQADIEEAAGRRVSLGSIHLTMSRMEERGMVASELGRPSGARGGKAKRLYQVTPRGRAALRHAREVYERMWAGVPEAAR